MREHGANSRPQTTAEETFGLSRRARIILEYSPAFILFPFWIVMIMPATQDFAFQMVQEGYPVEVLTALCAFRGGVLGLWVSFRAFQRHGLLSCGFHAIFAVGLIFLGGEEIAWGQSLFGFATPTMLDQINTQHEMTLHNIEGWQGHNHLLRLAFGAGGLAGIALGRLQKFRSIAAPRLLHLWFALIVFKSLVDIYIKNTSVGDMTFYIVNQLSEVVEMMVAMAGLLYVWLNGRKSLPMEG